MNRPKRGLVPILLGCLLVMTTIPLVGSVSVAPLSMRSEVEPGSTDVLAFVVRNEGSEAAVVTVTLHDWWRTADGGFLLLAPETLERSCAGWTVYSIEELSLDPGEEQQVTVELMVPEEVSGDHWAVFLVEEQPDPVEQEQADQGLNDTTRVVVTYAVKILYVDPLHHDAEAEIRGIALQETDPLRVSIDFINTGSCHLTTRGSVEIRDIFGETVRSLAVDPFPSLPQEQRSLVINDAAAEPLADGTYYVVAVLDYAGDHLIQGGVQFEIQDGTLVDEL